jgi:hypothetical protein
VSDYAYGFQQITHPDAYEFGRELAAALDSIHAKGYDLVNLDTQMVLMQQPGDLGPRPYWIAIIVFGNRSAGTATSSSYISGPSDDGDDDD